MAVRQINIHSLTLLQAHCPFSRLHAQRQPDLCRGRAGGHHFGLCIRPRCSKLYTSSEVKQSHVLPSSLFSSPQPASGQQITGLSNITGRTKKMCHLIGKLSTVPAATPSVPPHVIWPLTMGTCISRAAQKVPTGRGMSLESATK